MTLKDTQELIDNTNTSLIKDFVIVYHRKPEGNELLQHLKHILKEGYQEDILDSALGEEINCPNDYYKLLLLVAASK
jgi:hypothetical protein